MKIIKTQSFIDSPASLCCPLMGFWAAVMTFFSVCACVRVCVCVCVSARPIHQFSAPRLKRKEETLFFIVITGKINI